MFSVVRSSAARRVPAVFARGYVSPVRSEGATASSKGFAQREEAEEGQYIRRKEQEALKAAKAKLAAAQAEVDKHQAEVDKSKK